MFNFLPTKASKWILQKSSIDIQNSEIQSITISPKGSAKASLRDKQITMSSQIIFSGECSPQENTLRPNIIGYLYCMYAQVSDSITEKLTPEKGMVISLPVNQGIDIYTEQEQLKTTELYFEIVNKSSVDITITKPRLMCADIKNIVYTDDKGVIDSNTVTYTIECGHTLTDGTFYFNRSYVDKPYYTTPQDPTAQIKPLVNASNKYIGGKIISAKNTSTLVVCYCALGG